MKHSIIIAIIIAIALAACSDTTQQSDDEDVNDVQSEIIDTGLEDYGLAMSQVDSLGQCGKFSAARADDTRALICMNAERYRLANYYAERGMDAAITSGRDCDEDVICSRIPSRHQY